MKNSLIVLTLVLIFKIIFLNLGFAQDQFNFDVTEIEINEKGNKYKGLKRGTISTNDGVYIDADTFEFDKVTNILNAYGNVIIKDKKNNLTINSEDITFLRNENKIFTKTRSKAFSNDIYIDADSLEYDKKLNTLNAKGNVKVNEKVKKLIINSDEVTYYKDSEIFISQYRSEAIGEGLIIKADEFEYNNILNLVNANKNVKIVDKVNDMILLTESVTYLKNKEKVFTQGNTETIVESKYNFSSKDTILLRNEMQLSSAQEATLKDDDGSIYNFSSFDYSINQKILKGNDVKITTNLDKENSDQFFFSSGIFNLNNKKFTGKDTKILLHKNIFNKEKEKFLELIEKTEINKMINQDITFENEPRLYGVSSKGDDSKTIIKKGVFTSCKKNDDCPAWSMKSAKITHDKQKRQLMYENSILNFYNIPVFYFPKFFHPDPTVKRQSGLLRPQLNRSETLGTSLYLPYYHVISDNKDYTFKPQIFDSEIEMYQNEYRQVNKNSTFIADFGITTGYQSSLPGSNRNSIGHLFSKLEIDLNFENYLDSEFNINFESVTNDTFLNVFQNNLIKSSVKPDSYNSLSSGFSFILDHENYNFDTGMQIYETLSGSESDRYEYSFPYYNYSTNIRSELVDGSFGFSSSGSNVLNNTNVLKSAINNNLSYSSLDYFSNMGFKNNYGIEFKNLNTIAKNHNIYTSSFQSQVMSIFFAGSTFPLIKNSKNYSETISPEISFRLNPGQMKNLPSRGVNIDNIFSINRLGLSEAYEKGKSLTIGLNYKKKDNNSTIGVDLNNDGEISEIEKMEKFFEIKLAGVLRDVVEDKISTSTTLNRKSSNLFGSITNKMSDKVQLNYKFAVDNDLSTFESNDINLKFSLNNFITTFGFYETNGEMGDSNSISNSTLLKFNDNNYLTFATSRNRKISLTEYYDLLYEYKNDCLTAGFKYKKTYYSDRDAKPTEDLLLTLTLFPLTSFEQNVDQNFYRENDLFN